MKKNKVRLGYVDPKVRRQLRIMAAQDGKTEEEILQKLLESIGEENNKVRKKYGYLDI